ncbi:chromate efflux transporter [Pyruvatibacter mobilis]|uniref:chromate efflux transporter n=1 Tax=Pyruvatibacter mobilis TaxID=1712261 RepID=UPI003BAA1396
MAEVFFVFLRLGLTAFGGPVAHIGYFRDEFVTRRRWISDEGYADLVALCQFLPGPASSQVGLGLGLLRAGPAGALAAWLGFTLPSALLMAGAAFSLLELGEAIPAGLLAGLKAVVVGVVAHALLGMGRSLTPDLPRLALAGAALALTLVVGGVTGQLAAIALGIIAGLAFLRGLAPTSDRGSGLHAPFPRRLATLFLVVFALLLVGLPLLAAKDASLGLAIADGFYRSGALVFGGGHVVLPLLQAETVAPGLVGATEFTAGYGLAQAMPGPLFTFAAFLGGAAGLDQGVAAASLYAALALVMVFLPGALLLAAALPFWAGLRANHTARAALTGVNAAVVGILAAALYTPVATTAIHDWTDIAIALMAFLALQVLRWPAWVVVPIGAGFGLAFAAFA